MGRNFYSHDNVPYNGSLVDPYYPTEIVSGILKPKKEDPNNWGDKNEVKSLEKIVEGYAKGFFNYSKSKISSLDDAQIDYSDFTKKAYLEKLFNEFKLLQSDYFTNAITFEEIIGLKEQDCAVGNVRNQNILFSPEDYFTTKFLKGDLDPQEKTNVPSLGVVNKSVIADFKQQDNPKETLKNYYLKISHLP